MEVIVFSARPPDWWKDLLVGVPIGSFVGIMFAMSLFLAAGELDNPELPPSMAWLPAAQVMSMVALLLIALLHMVLQVRAAAPARNFLRIDETGLTFTRFGKSRTWAWPEISPFERDHSFVPRIRFLLPNLDPEQARRDRWVHEMTPKGAMVVAADIYDAPLDEIIAKLNEYREQTLAAAPDPA